MMEGPDEYEKDQLKAIGQYFAEMRQEQGLTQRGMAAKLNTRQGQISKFENGLSVFYFTSLQQWARALGYRVELNLIPIEEIEQEKFNNELLQMMQELETETTKEQ